jgi:hypothetical protein
VGVYGYDKSDKPQSSSLKTQWILCALHRAKILIRGGVAQQRQELLYLGEGSLSAARGFPA